MVKLNFNIIFALFFLIINSLPQLHAMTSSQSNRDEDKIKNSDHYKDGYFFNPTLPEKKSFWDVLKWQFTSEKKAWPNLIESTEVLRNTDIIKRGELRITFINHSTFLLEFNGLNILTDPIWSLRASPFTFAGPKRVQAPGIKLDDLPRIDIVIISHNHYDHLDLETLKELSQKFKPKFFVAQGDKKLLSESGIENISELDWNDLISIGDSSQLTFLKCRHWSARGLFDRFKSLWGAYLIEHQGIKVYFGGDTGYAEHFKEAGEKYKDIDVALLPVGAYEPRWFMKNFHMNPEEAFMAAKDLKSKLNFGMHLETFQLTDEAFLEPRLEVERLKKNSSYGKTHLQILKHGESFLFQKSIL